MGQGKRMEHREGGKEGRATSSFFPAFFVVSSPNTVRARVAGDEEATEVNENDLRARSAFRLSLRTHLFRTGEGSWRWR